MSSLILNDSPPPPPKVEPTRIRPTCDDCRFNRIATNPAGEMQHFCTFNPPGAQTMFGRDGSMTTFPVQPPLPPSRYCGKWEADNLQ